MSGSWSSILLSGVCSRNALIKSRKFRILSGIKHKNISGDLRRIKAVILLRSFYSILPLDNCSGGFLCPASPFHSEAGSNGKMSLRGFAVPLRYIPHLLWHCNPAASPPLSAVLQALSHGMHLPAIARYLSRFTLLPLRAAVMAFSRAPAGAISFRLFFGYTDSTGFQNFVDFLRNDLCVDSAQ